jgi:hypothetical protein
MPVKPFVGLYTVFQILHPIHNRKDSLGGGSVYGKTTTYTIDNTSTELKEASKYP